MAKDEGKSSFNSTTKVKKFYFLGKSRIRGSWLKLFLFTTLYKKGQRAQYHVDFFSQKCVSLNK